MPRKIRGSSVRLDEMEDTDRMERDLDKFYDAMKEFAGALGQIYSWNCGMCTPHGLAIVCLHSLRGFPDGEAKCALHARGRFPLLLDETGQTTIDPRLDPKYARGFFDDMRRWFKRFINPLTPPP